MKKIKPFFLAAKSKKAQHTLKVLSQKYNNYDLKEANIVVVLGGDGTILSLINDEVYLKEFYQDKSYTIRLLENYRNQLTYGAERKWVVPKDYYFVMGDNRDNSADSRSWGFVPKQNVVGKPAFIWMHWECLTCLPSFSRNKFLN